MPQDTASYAALMVLEAVLLGRLGKLGLRVSGDDLAEAEIVLRELDIADLCTRYLGESALGNANLSSWRRL